jgi:hypothetical protein
MTRETRANKIKMMAAMMEPTITAAITKPTTAQIMNNAVNAALSCASLSFLPGRTLQASERFDDKMISNRATLAFYQFNVASRLCHSIHRCKPPLELNQGPSGDLYPACRSDRECPRRAGIGTVGNVFDFHAPRRIFRDGTPGISSLEKRVSVDLNFGNFPVDYRLAPRHNLRIRFSEEQFPPRGGSADSLRRSGSHPEQ